MRPSQAIAVAGYLLLVPGCIALAYAGHSLGLYPFAAVPVVLGVALVAALGALFAILPRVRSRLG